MKRFSFSLLLTGMVMFSVACSGGSPSSGEREVEKTDLPEVEETTFDWRNFEGEEINVMLNQHPYAEAIIEKIPDFQEKTGIKVNHALTPEENYFDRLTTALNAKNGNPDVFMTGSYQIWEYAPAGYMQELDAFLEDEVRTSPDYNVSDFFEGVLNSDRWDLTPGNPVGTGNLWAIPLGFETNVLSYNKRAFEENGIEKPPATFEELIEVAEKLKGWNGPESYGVGVRGTRSWATIHPGYMTAFANHGAKDFAIEDGKLVSLLNSPESIEITTMFRDLIQVGGPSDWSSYTWYQVSNDLGAGNAAITFDANLFAFFNNAEGASREAGNIAMAPPPKSNPDQPLSSNVWVWSIAMNASSEKKDAAWMFMQYFTGEEFMTWGSSERNLVDPVRQSVWESVGFQDRIAQIDGYEETFNAVIENASIQFTPQPEFFNATTEWASALQDIVNGADVEERMNKLTEDINNRVSRIR